MARLILASSLVMMSLLSCKSLKNQGGGDVSDKGSMQCPSDSNPSCTATTTSTSMASSKMISGRCEVIITGSAEPLPCTDMTLTIHSKHTAQAEERSARVDGFNFKFSDLSKDSYELVAASPNFELTTDTKELSPGQTVTIRVNARPIQ